jgi:transcriptional regulator with XRE-family HTH domain
LQVLQVHPDRHQEIMDNLPIPAKLRIARIARDLTQKELGKLVSLSESTISRIESRESIDTDRLADFSIALNVDKAFFYRSDVDVNEIFRVD